MNELEFNSKYITPYYMDLMNLNFLNKSDNEIERLFNSLWLIHKELDDQVLIKMLKGSWRSSKVAAWVIGVSRRSNLLVEIVDKLKTSGIQYSEHLLLNVLILKENPQKHIRSFLYQQIDFFIEINNVLALENLSIDWALSILNFIDKKDNTAIVQNILVSDEWVKFDNKLKNLPYYELIKKRFEPDYFEEELNTLVERLKIKNCIRSI